MCVAREHCVSDRFRSSQSICVLQRFVHNATAILIKDDDDNVARRRSNGTGEIRFSRNDFVQFSEAQKSSKSHVPERFAPQRIRIASIRSNDSSQSVVRLQAIMRQDAAGLRQGDYEMQMDRSAKEIIRRLGRASFQSI